MNILRFELNTIDSTQNWAKENAPQFSRDNFVIITANTQTAGRGRQKKIWYSPPNCNIYMTFSFCLKKRHDLCSITLMLAVITAKWFKTIGLEPQIKWPNDILIHNQKIAGILAETTSEKDFIRIFLGIGININMSEEDCKKIDQPTTSLRCLSHKDWDINEIITLLSQNVRKELKAFESNGFAGFVNDFEPLCMHTNKTLTIDDGHKHWTGVYKKINSDGSLLVELTDGSTKSFASATIINQE